MAQEIAYNHNKRMAVEISTNALDEVQSYLSRLDFTLIPCKALAAGYQLVGGRYCSVGGKLAAQLKYLNPKTGKVVTVYQFPKSKGVNASQIATRHFYGSKVQLWEEKGLIMAVAD